MQRRWVISIKRYQKDIQKYNVLKEYIPEASFVT